MAQAPSAAPAAQRHRVTVKFNYNFARTHACGPKNTDKICVKEFNVYNLTDKGQRYKLFAFPAPENSRKPLEVVSSTSPELPFSPGQHLIAVTAVSNTGKESNAYACTAMIYIKP